jgi:hypothetical protein
MELNTKEYNFNRKEFVKTHQLILNNSTLSNEELIRELYKSLDFLNDCDSDYLKKKENQNE